MSSSSRARTSHLTVTAPIGVEIEIFDARFRSLIEGAGKVELDLEPGLYNVSWKAGDESEERIVRVREGSGESVHGGEFAAGSNAHAASSGASALEAKQRKVVAKAIAKSSHSHAAEILVVVRSNDDRPTADLGRSVRLSDREGEDMRSDRERKSKAGARSNQVAVRRYAIDPGPYLLRYEASDRRTMQQTVHAFDGRQTVVMLNYGASLITETVKSSVRITPRRGIDPAQSIFFSLRLHEASTEEFEEAQRLAEILLHKLRKRDSLFDPALMELLVAPQADPYLKLYGAVQLLDGAKRQPVAGPHGNAADDGVRRLADQLGELELPDVLCLNWRLDSSSHGQATLDTPPMLDLCWRWAAEHSIAHEQAIAHTPFLAAAAMATDPTPPWLVWKSVDARSADSPVDHGFAGTSVADLTHQVASLVEDLGKVRIPGVIDERLADLSPATIEYANAAVSVASGKPDLGAEDIARRIAFATGTPGKALAFKLGDALSELRSRSLGDEIP